MASKKRKSRSAQESHRQSITKIPNLLLDIGVVVVALVLAYLFPDYTDIILIAAWLLFVPYLLLTHRSKMIYAFGVASVVALIWLTVNVSRYTYNHNFVRIFGLNSVGLLTWALGLIGCYVFASHIPVKRFHWRLIVYAVVFWVLLLAIETLAFHVLGVQNQSTGSTKGLPICDCLHAPPWMQLAYFLQGPAYYVLHELFIVFLLPFLKRISS
jgi:hypothetical protein